MLKATKVFTVINCIMSGITSLFSLVLMLSLVDVHFGTMVPFVFSFYCTQFFGLIALIFSINCVIKKKGVKPLIVNIIALAVATTMIVVMFATE